MRDHLVESCEKAHIHLYSGARQCRDANSQTFRYESRALTTVLKPRLSLGISATLGKNLIKQSKREKNQSRLKKILLKTLVLLLLLDSIMFVRK